MRYLILLLIPVTIGLSSASAVASVDITPENYQAGQAYIHPSRTIQTQALQAFDDIYHNGSTLYCSHCHVMHASQQHQHDNQTGPDPFGAYPQSYTPSPTLLKASDPVALCLTCHDGLAGVPDVVGSDANGLIERSAGFFDDVNADNPRGHKIAFGVDVSPGFGLCMRCHFGGTFETAALSCLDCHNPHGNGRPRNLQWASDPGGEPQFGLFTNPAATGMSKYERDNVAYGTTNDVIYREVSNMCLDCHHVLTGATYIDPDGDDIHERHPSYDSERNSTNNIAQGQTEGTSAPAHWEDGTGAGFLVTSRLRFVNNGATDFATASTVDANTNGVFCLSCHKAHGGQHAFALLWDPTSGINGEGCDQCHNKTMQ